MPIPMLWSVVRWFIPAQTDSGLVPAENYLAKFYEAGTDTPKAIYDTDGNIYPSPSSVAVLNGEGYAALRLGDGAYKLRICTPETTPSADGGDAVYTEDNISGLGTFGTGFVDTVIANEVDETIGLANVDTNANRWCFAGGYWDKGDGGHGMFWNETSSTADDGGYVIASTFDPTKRWFRVPDESGDIRAASFGYVGTKSGNLGTNLIAAAAYANGRGRLVIGKGLSATVGSGGATFSLTCQEIHFEQGSTLTAFTGVTSIVIAGQVTGPDSQIFGLVGSYVPITFTSNITFTSPSWFGASRGTGGTIGANNVISFAQWFDSATVQSIFIVPPGNWPYTNTTTFPYPTLSPVVFQGKIVHQSAGSDIPTGFYLPADSQVRLHKLLFDEGFNAVSAGANYALFTGSASWVGSITLSATLTASTLSANSVTGTSQVIGGTVYGGGRAGYPVFIGTAGQSVKQFAPGGNFFLFNGSADIHDNTHKYAYTMDANFLDNNFSGLKITSEGTIGAGSADVIRMDLNSVKLVEFDAMPTISSGTAHWSIEGKLIRVTSTTALFTGMLYVRISTTTTPIYGGTIETAITGLDFTASQVMNTYLVSGSSTTVTLNFFHLNLISVSPQ